MKVAGSDRTQVRGFTTARVVAAALLSASAVSACEVLLDAGSLRQGTEDGGSPHDASTKADAPRADSTRPDAVRATDATDASRDARDAGGARETSIADSRPNEVGQDAPVGCVPHPLPPGFTAKSIAVAPATCGSQSMEVAAFANCVRFRQGACDLEFPVLFGGAATDAQTCAACLGSPLSATVWGGLVALTPSVADGAVDSSFTSLSLNPGGCIAKAPTGSACAAALDAQRQCEIAACLPYCPVNGPGDIDGSAALFGSVAADGGAGEPGCLVTADTSVCQTFVAAAQTSCASDANASAYQTCKALAASAPLAGAGLEQYLGLLCGGYDSGVTF